MCNVVQNVGAIDFAYRIHTEVGHKCVGVKINGKMMPINTVLNVGDVVEIITSNGSKGPSWDWLKVVKTNCARAKIRQFFKREMAEDKVKIGKQMLEIEAKNKGYNLSELLTPLAFQRVSSKLAFTGTEEMFAAVGCGAVTVNQVLLKLLDFHKKEVVPQNIPHHTNIASKIIHSTGDVTIKGIEGLLIRFARCCNPVPGDKIVGFVSRGRGVMVHRHDCPNMKAEDPNRLLEAQWTGRQGEEGYSVSLRIHATEDATILASVSSGCKKYNLFILAINGRIDNKNHISIIDLTLKINKTEDLDNFIREMKEDKCVIDVFRNTN